MAKKKIDTHWIINPSISDTQRLEMFEAFVSGVKNDEHTEGYTDGYAEGYGKGVRYRKEVKTAKEMNALGLNAVIFGPDAIAWQAISAVDEELHWSSSQDGWKWSYSSQGLILAMRKLHGATNTKFRVLMTDEWNS